MASEFPGRGDRHEPQRPAHENPTGGFELRHVDADTITPHVDPSLMRRRVLFGDHSTDRPTEVVREPVFGAPRDRPAVDRLIDDLVQSGVRAGLWYSLEVAVDAAAPGMGYVVERLRIGWELLGAARSYVDGRGVDIRVPVITDQMTGFSLGVRATVAATDTARSGDLPVGLMADLNPPHPGGFSVEGAPADSAPGQAEREGEPPAGIRTVSGQAMSHRWAAVVGTRGEICAATGRNQVDAEALRLYAAVGSVEERTSPQPPFVVAYVDPDVGVGVLALVPAEEPPYAPLLFAIDEHPDAEQPVRLWFIGGDDLIGGDDAALVRRLSPVPTAEEIPEPDPAGPWESVSDCADCDTRLVVESDPDGDEIVRLVIDGPTCPSCDPVAPAAPPGDQPLRVTVELYPWIQRPDKRPGDIEESRSAAPGTLRYRVYGTALSAPARPVEPDEMVEETLEKLEARVAAREPAHPGGEGGPATGVVRLPAPAGPQAEARAVACEVLAEIARILDQVRAWLGRTAGQVVEIVVKATGAPAPVAAIVGAMVEKAVTGHLLRPVRSLANTLRLAGIGVCAAQGRHLTDCRCARDLARDVLKQAATETAHDLTTEAADRIFRLLPEVVRSPVTPATPTVPATPKLVAPAPERDPVLEAIKEAIAATEVAPLPPVDLAPSPTSPALQLGLERSQPRQEEPTPDRAPDTGHQIG